MIPLAWFLVGLYFLIWTDDYWLGTIVLGQFFIMINNETIHNE